MTTDAVFARILVPTDFSSGSTKAWQLAQRLGIAVGAELVLLHVLPASPLDLRDRHEEEERRAAIRTLQASHQLGIPRSDPEEERSVPRFFSGPLTGAALAEFSEAGKACARSLEAWADGARGAGCKVQTLLRSGDAYREVVAAAQDEHVDLVLLATHGRGEIHRLLVGSVADRVMRLAPCPVLTLKEA
ncbi:MAG: universal stress protein [Candidatus Rokubacteria bacterium]|nr:universal stress protein [Candidatus Rokubacteria bacterium]